MSEWKIYKLGDIATFQTGKLNSNAAVSNGQYPFFTCSPITLSIDTWAFDKEAIILAGNNAEGNFSIKYYKGKFNAYQRTYIIEAMQGICDTKFLYYSLKIFLKHFKRLSQGTSTKFLTAVILRSIEISLPPLAEQKRIADILSAIDDKIELNRRINVNLEQQAQALYKSWFVDFEPFGGKMPEDWREGTLGDICTELKEKVHERDDVKVLSPVATGQLMLSEEFFTKQVYSKSIVKYIVVPQNCFAYNPARVNIGSLGMNEFDFDGCVSPVYVVFRCQNGYEYFFDLFRQTKPFKDEVKLRAIGGVRQTLSYDDFARIQVNIPTYNVVQDFNKIYLTNFDIRWHNQYEILRLAHLRDTLLPKLMSGDITV